MILHKNKGDFVSKPKSMKITLFNLITLSLLLSLEPFLDIFLWGETYINYYYVFARISLCIVILVLTYFYSQYSSIARILLILGMIISLINYEQHLLVFLYATILLIFNFNLTVLFLFMFYGFIIQAIFYFLILNLLDKKTKSNFRKIDASEGLSTDKYYTLNS